MYSKVLRLTVFSKQDSVVVWEAMSWGQAGSCSSDSLRAGSQRRRSEWLQSNKPTAIRNMRLRKRSVQE